MNLSAWMLFYVATCFFRKRALFYCFSHPLVAACVVALSCFGIVVYVMVF